ncbi:MAG: NAD(+)/NADH kinase [Calditrichaceae bacterium]
MEDWLEKTKYSITVLVCTYKSKYLKHSFKHIQECNEDRLLRESQLILTLGGDGTILRAVQAITDKQIPILGVNLGGLGFLADTSPEKMINNLEAYLSENYFIENRIVLKCKIENDDQTYYALNDFVIDKSGFSRVIEIITHVDENLLNSYVADGLIISTPTGSTGYSLSAGGPILVPKTNVFIINPICPHSLTNRPVVINDNSQITLQVYTEYKEMNIYRDGQFVNNYPSGILINISKASFAIKLIKMKEMSFFETLRNKLHWGEDFRDKKRWSYNDK